MRLPSAALWPALAAAAPLSAGLPLLPGQLPPVAAAASSSEAAAGPASGGRTVSGPAHLADRGKKKNVIIIRRAHRSDCSLALYSLFTGVVGSMED